jgi:hypothetical protein
MTTEVLDPRGAATDNDEQTTGDGELASLVRRWMAVGGRAQPRTRRDQTLLRLAPLPVEGDTDDGEQAAAVPVLPHRRTGTQPEQVTRIAVLMDAGRVSDEVAAGLLAHLDSRGSLAVCRVYADWRRTDLGGWVERLGREGLHSFHQYAEDDDQALVAMTLDAVDLARDPSVDEVVLVGDLTSMLPLVHRLHAAGVRVVAVGEAHTPHDVRAACHEFIDADSLDGTVAVARGRHRA